MAQLPATTPETSSEQLKDTVGALAYQPFVPVGDAGLTACVIVGPRPSIRNTPVASEPSEPRASTMCPPSPLRLIAPAAGASGPPSTLTETLPPPLVAGVTDSGPVYH